MTELSQGWSGSVWKNVGLDSSFYDAKNNMIKYLQQGWNNGNLVNYSFQTYSFDVNNNEISYANQTWLSGFVRTDSTHYYYRAALSNIGSQINIIISPNPTSSVLYIEGITNSSIVKLYNVVGKLILQTDADSNTQINISHLPRGIYFLEIIMDGEKVVRKVVKI
jgi:hypothetical protein